jgi:tetratricopeptide (TPR) repeat protein
MRHSMLALLLLAIPGNAQEMAHNHGTHSSPKKAESSANRFGSVQFETSCTSAIKDDFNTAVALLHSFEYDEAQVAFTEIYRKDPTCAMARWGESMSYFHGIWNEFDASKGARAAAEGRQVAAENLRTTEREKAYIAAISEIFNEDAIKRGESFDNKPDILGYSRPSPEAEARYTQRMADLHTQFPADKEATIFYALALDVGAPRGDKTHADQRHCIALLQPLFGEMPDHPGVAHYIIHCSDNPEMAKGGLEAARKYAQIAPASAHATHMPSHIFAELGLWDEMAESNRVSLRAAEQDKDASPCETVGNALHAMSYLVIALAETGELKEAQSVLERASKLKSGVPGADRCYDEANLVFAVYVLNTGDWNRAKNITLEGDPGPAISGNLWLTLGLAAAHSGDRARALEAEQHLAVLRDAGSKLHAQIPQNAMEMFRLAVAGSRAEQEGRKAEAVYDLRESANLQDRLGLSYNTIKPMREMLADLLLINGDSAQALVEYQTVLAHKTNRFDSLYGAGSSAFAIGDIATAKVYYEQLLAVAKGEERPELITARTRMTQNSAKSAP